MSVVAKGRRSRLVAVVAGVVATAMFAAIFAGSAAAAEVDREEQLRECDEFVESYLRSSARKLGRALSREEYGLEVVDLDDVITLDVWRDGREEAIDFEVFREEDDKVVGVAARDRRWNQTYIVARGLVGPIIVSQTWQPRHLRDQGCDPIESTVERPEVLTPTVDVEPFEYWGLRASWRVQRPADVDEPDRRRKVEQVLGEVIREFADNRRESTSESSKVPAD